MQNKMARTSLLAPEFIMPLSCELWSGLMFQFMCLCVLFCSRKEKAKFLQWERESEVPVGWSCSQGKQVFT